MSPKFERWKNWGAIIGVVSYYIGEFLGEILQVATWLKVGIVALFLLIGSAFLDIYMDLKITEKEKEAGEID